MRGIKNFARELGDRGKAYQVIIGVHPTANARKQFHNGIWGLLATFGPNGPFVLVLLIRCTPMIFHNTVAPLKVWAVVCVS